MTSLPPPDDSCDFEIHDDAIIGRAFMWSLVVFAGLGVLGAGVWLISAGGGPEEEQVVAKVITPPEPLLADLSVLPEVSVRDISLEAGLTVPHVSGAVGDKLLPETMGGGAAFADLDGDGDQDLLLASGAWWPDAQERSETSSRVWLNDGQGRFADGGDAWAFGQGRYGVGIACGDYDADGKVDVFLAALGGDRLYRNTGTGLEDVTSAAGVAGPSDAWSTSAAFVDTDGDGDLDLFVPHYIRWTREKDESLGFTLNGTDRAYGPPKQYEGTHPTLWRNEGDGSFVDVSVEAGMEVINPATGAAVGKSLAVAPIDIDRDGDMDLIVANDTTANFLYRNQGDGTFVEEGTAAGLAYDARGMATGAMGIDVGHYRNDASIGVGIGNFANEMTSFYVAESPGGWFTDEAAVEGIGAPTRSLLSFGLLLVDYDLDGRLDLFQTNGHLEEDISEVQASQRYAQPAQLFWNEGKDSGGTFRIVPPEECGDLARPIVGRGASAADIDGDGDLDFVITQPGGTPVLLRNDQALGHHWLRVELRDPDSANTAAIGAWIEVDAGGMTQRRQVMPSRSYLSQVELPVTFGLGASDAVEQLRVVWPDGDVDVIDVDGVDRLIVVDRAASS